MHYINRPSFHWSKVLPIEVYQRNVPYVNLLLTLTIYIPEAIYIVTVSSHFDMMSGEMVDLTKTKRGLYCREVRHIVNLNNVNHFFVNLYCEQHSKMT